MQFDQEIDSFLRAEGLTNMTNNRHSNGGDDKNGGAGSSSGSSSGSGSSSSGSTSDSSSGDSTALPPRRIVLSGLPQTLLPYLYSLAHALVIPSHGEGTTRAFSCLCHSYISTTRLHPLHTPS